MLQRGRDGRRGHVGAVVLREGGDRVGLCIRLSCRCYDETPESNADGLG